MGLSLLKFINTKSPLFTFDLLPSQSEMWGQTSKCRRSVSRLTAPTGHFLSPPSSPFDLQICVRQRRRESGPLDIAVGAGEPARRGHAMKICLSMCPPQFIKRHSERRAGILTLIIQSLGGKWHGEASSASCCATVKMRC